MKITLRRIILLFAVLAVVLIAIVACQPESAYVPSDMKVDGDITVILANDIKVYQVGEGWYRIVDARYSNVCYIKMYGDAIFCMEGH